MYQDEIDAIVTLVIDWDGSEDGALFDIEEFFGYEESTYIIADIFYKAGKNGDNRYAKEILDEVAGGVRERFEEWEKEHVPEETFNNLLQG